MWLTKAHVPAYPRGCNGCGEDDLVGAGPEQPATRAGLGRWIYVPVPPGVVGRVDLQAVASTFGG